MRRLGVSIAAAALLLGGAGAAWADPPGWAPAHGHRQAHERGYHGEHRWRARERAVVVRRYYAPRERVVIVQPPPVVRERVVVRAAPVVRERVVVRDYRGAYYYGAGPAPTYYSGYSSGSNRLLSGAVLGAAGGLLGSQVRAGNGRLAATAAGAVAGWVLGTNLGGR